GRRDRHDGADRAGPHGNDSRRAPAAHRLGRRSARSGDDRRPPSQGSRGLRHRQFREDRNRDRSAASVLREPMRYLPHTPDDRTDMLAAIGAKSIDGLFADIPADKRLKTLLDLPTRKTELDVTRILRAMSRRSH